MNGNIIFYMYVATVLLLQFQKNISCKRNTHYNITSDFRCDNKSIEQRIIERSKFA